LPLWPLQKKASEKKKIDYALLYFCKKTDYALPIYIKSNKSIFAVKAIKGLPSPGEGFDFCNTP
jgi:hypothetical protein